MTNVSSVQRGETVGLPLMLHWAPFEPIIVPFWGNPWAQEQLSSERQSLSGNEKLNTRQCFLYDKQDHGNDPWLPTQSLDWTSRHILNNHLLYSCLEVPWIDLTADLAQDDSVAVSNAAVTVFLMCRGGILYAPLVYVSAFCDCRPVVADLACVFQDHGSGSMPIKGLDINKTWGSITW